MFQLAKDARQNRTVRSTYLAKPLFIQISRQLAAFWLTAAALVVLAASSIGGTQVGVESSLLLLCGFGAWFVGNRFALLLGLLALSLQGLTRQWSLEAALWNGQAADLAFDLACAATVVLMLGVARVALEIEWKSARMDPLTGALNRKAFFELMNRTSKTEHKALLIFADLDGLKQVNDEQGHQRGDLMLKEFAVAIASNIRDEDIFARLGGDEFAIFMNLPNITSAATVASRLENSINQRSSGGMSISCSLGVLFLPQGSKSIDLELKFADQLMYQAKTQGTGMCMAVLEAPDRVEQSFPELHALRPQRKFRSPSASTLTIGNRAVLSASMGDMS